MSFATTNQSIIAGDIPVNGRSMYYEIRGTGDQPLLLHSGLSTINASFGPILSDLSSCHRVLAVEQHEQRHKSNTDRQLTTRNMVDDTAELLRQLAIRSVDVFGSRDGSDVALGLAIRHPDLVRKVAIAGIDTAVSRLYSEFMKSGTETSINAVREEPRDTYRAFAQDRPECPACGGESVFAHRLSFPDWATSQLQSIEAPTLIIGDRETKNGEHALELHRLIPKAEFALLPDTTHGRLDRTRLMKILSEFLRASGDDVNETQWC